MCLLAVCSKFVGQHSSLQAQRSVPFIPVLLFEEQNNIFKTKGETSYSLENCSSSYGFPLFLPFELPAYHVYYIGVNFDFIFRTGEWGSERIFS